MQVLLDQAKKAKEAARDMEVEMNMEENLI